MDMLRLKYEMIDESVLEKYLSTHKKFPEHDKTFKYCTLLIEYLYRHGITFNNQQIMQYLFYQWVSGQLDKLKIISKYLISSSEINDLKLENFMQKENIEIKEHLVLSRINDYEILNEDLTIDVKMYK